MENVALPSPMPYLPPNMPFGVNPNSLTHGTQPYTDPLFNFLELHDDLDHIRREHEEDIIIMRDADGSWMNDNTVQTKSNNLPPQKFRVAVWQNPQRESNDKTRDVHERVIILGVKGSDIQADDRFRWEGSLFRVIQVYTHQDHICTRAVGEKVN